MGQTVGAVACGSLMDLTYQPEASWAVSSGLGGHHGLQQERHHDWLTALRRGGGARAPIQLTSNHALF